MAVDYDLNFDNKILRVDIKGSYQNLNPVILWRTIFEQAVALGGEGILFVSTMVDQIPPNVAKNIGLMITEFPQIKGIAMVPVIIPNTARLENYALTKIFAGFSGSKFRTIYEIEDAKKWLDEIISNRE